MYRVTKNETNSYNSATIQDITSEKLYVREVNPHSFSCSVKLLYMYSKTLRNYQQLTCSKTAVRYLTIKQHILYHTAY